VKPTPRLLALALTLLTGGAHDAATLPEPGPGTHCANLASAPDGTVHLTYYGPPPESAVAGARSLWLTSLTAGATEWTPPRPIVTTPLLQENWADFASVVAGTDGALTAQWFQREAPDARGYAGWYSRSEDGGRSWRIPARLGHEFVALAPLAAGDTLAVWLEGAHPHHVGGTGHLAAAAKATHGGGMRLLGRILAPDGTVRRDWILDPMVCDCCQNTAVTLGDGRVFVAYRGRTRGEIRDNRYLVFDPATAAWSRSALLREDGWVIPACPVNGPAADALGEALTVAWFTAAGGQPRIHARHSADGARTLGEPQGIDLGQPMGRLDTVMLRDGSAVVTWLEAGGGVSEAGIYARRIFPGGGLSAPSLVAASSSARSSGFPRTARHGPEAVLVVWTQTGEAPRVRLTSIPLTTLGRAASAR